MASGLSPSIGYFSIARAAQAGPLLRGGNMRFVANWRLREARASYFGTLNLPVETMAGLTTKPRLAILSRKDKGLSGSAKQVRLI
jgi:hypothetical protein